MQLSFNYEFMVTHDEVFCAYTVPYTYTALLAHIKQLKLLARESCKFIKTNLSNFFYDTNQFHVVFELIKFESLG